MITTDGHTKSLEFDTTARSNDISKLCTCYIIQLSLAPWFGGLVKPSTRLSWTSIAGVSVLSNIYFSYVSSFGLRQSVSSHSVEIWPSSGSVSWAPRLNLKCISEKHYTEMIMILMWIRNLAHKYKSDKIYCSKSNSYPSQHIYCMGTIYVLLWYGILQ